VTAWTNDQSNAIENDHRELLTKYRRENDITSIIDQHDHTTTFNEAWDSLGGVRFHQLRRAGDCLPEFDVDRVRLVHP
jgi:hypothetical protein